MADEFDLIEARISVKINDGDLDGVKDQIDALTKKLNKLKVGVGMRLIGRKDFRDQLRSFLAGIKTGNKALISPVLANKSQLTKQIKEATSDAVGKGVSIKVSADVKEAEAALDRVIGKSRTVSSAGKRAAGSVDYLELQVKRWGRLNGRLSESKRLLDQISQPGFGSADDMEKIRSQMSYYDRLQNQATRIADLSTKLKEWGELPGRMAKSQELLAKVTKAGFGSQADFRRVDREMSRLDRTINNTARKNEARAYINEWGKASGKIQDAADLLKIVDQNDIFKSSDFKAIRELTKDIDKAAAAAAKAQRETAKLLATANKQLGIVSRPAGGNKSKFSNPFIPVENVQAAGIDAFDKFAKDAAKAQAEASKKIDKANKQLGIVGKPTPGNKSQFSNPFIPIESVQASAIDSRADRVARVRLRLAERAKRIAADMAASQQKVVDRAKEELSLQRRLSTQATLAAAQKKADYEFTRGRRDNTRVTVEDIKWATPFAKKREQAAKAAKDQLDAEAKLRKAQKADIARQGRRDQALRGALFEGGFVAGPVTAIAGNLVGVSNQVRKFTENTKVAENIAGLLGVQLSTVGKVAGVAGATLAAIAAPFAFGFSKAFEVVTEFNQRALAGLKAGLQSIVGPAAAVLQGIRNIATYLPFVVAGLGTLIAEDLTKATVEFDKLKSLFDLAFGGGSEQQLGLVRSVSDRYGVALDALAEGYAKITVASKKSGITVEETRDLFLGTASAAARLKLTGDDLQGVFRAYQQIISKSNVSSEELRSQLSERLPGAFGLAAEALGYSTDQLSEALAKREVSAEQFVPAFGAALRRTFDKDAEQIVDTLPAKLNRLQNSLLDLRRSAEGTGFLESFVDLKQAGIDTLLADGPIKNGLKTAFTEAGKALKFLTAQIPKVADLLGEVWTAVSPLVTAFATLQLIFSGLALGAVKELVTVNSSIKSGFGGAIKTLGEFSEKMRSLMNLDVTNVESVFAFVETLIKRSDLALKLFIRTLEIAIRGLIEFSVSLFVKLFDELVRFGSKIGLEIAKGIANGIQSGIAGTYEYRKRVITDEYRELKQFQKDLASNRENAIAPKSVLNLDAGEIRNNPRGVDGAIIKRLRELQDSGRELGMSFSELQGAPLDANSLVETTLSALSESTAAFFQNFADDPRLEELAKEFGFASDEVKALRAASEKANTGLESIGLAPRRKVRSGSGSDVAKTSDFESQFFGFEEFQKFLQSSETVKVAENTQRISEFAKLQYEILGEININQKQMSQRFGEGSWMTNGIRALWEN